MEAEALNTTAVIAGAVLAFLFGAVLYHPKVLGRIWAEGSGVELDGSMPVMAMVLQAAGLLALALVVGLTATLNLLGTAILAILAVLLFVAAMGAFVRKSNGAILTDVLFVLVSGILMIGAQGVL